MSKRRFAQRKFKPIKFTPRRFAGDRADPSVLSGEGLMYTVTQNMPRYTAKRNQPRYKGAL